jgi:CHAT domain-containing protein
VRGGWGHSGGDEHDERGLEARRQRLNNKQGPRRWSHWLWLACLVALLLVLIPLRDNDTDGAQTAYEHALRLFQQERIEAARAEAKDGWARYRESDPEWSTSFQLLYARTLIYSGGYKEILQVLAFFPDQAPSEEMIQRYVTEASAYRILGQQEAGTKRLALAEELCRRSDFAACGSVITEHASIAFGADQAETGRQYYLQAYQFASRHHDLWRQANISLNLGYRALQRERLDEAADWSQISYQISSREGYDGVAETASGNLGFAWYLLGDGERALQQLQEAEKSAELIGDEEDAVRWLNISANVYRDRYELTRATQVDQKALDMARKGGNQQAIDNLLDALASLDTFTDHLDEAQTLLNEARPMETAGGHKPRSIFVLIEGELATAQHEDAKAEGLFQTVLKDRKSSMADRLNAGNDLARMYEDEKKYASAERKYHETIAAWDAERDTITREESALSFGANVSQVYRNYVRFLVQRGRGAEALALADQSRARTLAKGLGFGQHAASAQEAMHPEQIARKTGATLLFYWLGDKESYLWAVGPERTEFATLPASQQISTWVTRYNKAILDGGDLTESANADGVALYAALIAPVKKVLDPKRPVIVLADGVLNQINFETLLAPEAVPAAGMAGQRQHYLLEDYTLESAPSMDLLARGGVGLDAKAQAKGEAAANLLLIGNAAAADADFPPLPLFGVEMTRIEGRFQPAETTVFTGAKATPAAYETANPEKFSYIHFVSHATASETSPLDSAIILSNPAGANAGGSASGGVNAYKLYARDIVTHKLTARLVTISACYGTGTRAYAGEGLVGLSWAFLRAGAQQVVAALWEVTDESTPRLMDGLYAGIVAGKKPADALREAKLAMLHSGTRFKEPFYWAPFQIYSRD